MFFPKFSSGSSYFANTTCLESVNKLDNINIIPIILAGINLPNMNGSDISIQNNDVPYFLLLFMVVKTYML